MLLTGLVKSTVQAALVTAIVAAYAASTIVTIPLHSNAPEWAVLRTMEGSQHVTCVAGIERPDRALLLIIQHNTGQVSIAIGAVDFMIPADTPIKAEITLEPAGPVVAYGYAAKGDGPRYTLYVEFSEEFLNRVARARTLSVYMNGRGTVWQMAGSSRAVEDLRACHAQFSRRETPAPRPEAPGKAPAGESSLFVPAEPDA